MPSWGVTAAGFAVKPLAQILADMQDAVLGAFGQDYDLSASTPDGQFLGIIANAHAAIWELIGIVYNLDNRADAEGAALDNIGDLVGIPRAGATSTQVYCNLTLDPASAPYTAGTLIASIVNSPAMTFSNLKTIQASDISGGVATGVVMVSTTPGPTPSIATGTLTVIASPVTGWTAITNTGSVTGSPGDTGGTMGTNAELDAQYAIRQATELAADGSCNPSATVAAIEKLGEAQLPPVTLTASIQENTGTAPITVGSLTLQPHDYAVFIYDQSGAWLPVAANQQLVAQVLWDNKPAGNTMVGSTSVTITDPVLGPVTVSFTTPTPEPLFISATIVAQPGVDWSQLSSNIQSALVNAATAPTPATGIPPAGQLMPGTTVIGSQLLAVIGNVPGVLEVKALTFDFTPSPTNTSPLPVDPAHIATIAAANIVLTQSATV